MFSSVDWFRMSSIDYFSEKGASVLAERVRRYWLARGHVVETRVEPVFTGLRCISPERAVTFAVRSDLINGKPQTSNPDGLAA